VVVDVGMAVLMLVLREIEEMVVDIDVGVGEVLVLVGDDDADVGDDVTADDELVLVEVLDVVGVVVVEEEEAEEEAEEEEEEEEELVVVLLAVDVEVGADGADEEDVSVLDVAIVDTEDE
jgi:hypothetical protein